MPLAALRNGNAGAAPLQCLSAATSALFAPGPFGATSDFVSMPDAIMMADPLEKPYWIFCTDPEPVPGAAGGASSSLSLLALRTITVLNC